MKPPAMSVLVVGAAAPTTVEGLPDTLLDVPFDLLPCRLDDALDEVARQAREGRQVEGILLDLEGLAADEAVSRAIHLARRCAAPVITRGDLGARRVLELVAMGVADHLPAASSPDQWLGRLLLAQDRRRTERELQRGYVAFRSVFLSLDRPLAVTDLEGRFEEGNPAFCELLGIPADELGSYTVEALTHPEDRDSLGLLRQLAAGERRAYNVRKRYLRGDGSVLWC